LERECQWIGSGDRRGYYRFGNRGGRDVPVSGVDELRYVKLESSVA